MQTLLKMRQICPSFSILVAANTYSTFLKNKPIWTQQEDKSASFPMWNGPVCISYLSTSETQENMNGLQEQHFKIIVLNDEPLQIKYFDLFSTDSISRTNT